MTIIAGFVLLVVIGLFIKRRRRDNKPIIKNEWEMVRIEPGEIRRIALSDGKVIKIKAIGENCVEKQERCSCSTCVLRGDSACTNIMCLSTQDRVGVHFVEIK